MIKNYNNFPFVCILSFVLGQWLFTTMGQIHWIEVEPQKISPLICSCYPHVNSVMIVKFQIDLEVKHHNLHTSFFKGHQIMRIEKVDDPVGLQCAQDSGK